LTDVLFACAQSIFSSSPGGGFEGSTELDELLASARKIGPPILCALGARGLCALTDRSRALTVEFLIRAGVYCHARVDMRMRETVHQEAAHLLHAFQTEAGAGAILGEATAAAVVDGQHIIETLLSSPLGGFGSHMHAHMQNSGIEGVHLAGSTEAADSAAPLDSPAASLLSSPVAASISPPSSHAALSALDCVRPAATRARLYALHSAVQRQMQISAMVTLVEEFAPIGPTDVMRVVATYLYSDAPSQSALDEMAVTK
jgi:hypothetical protein